MEPTEAGGRIDLVTGAHDAYLGTRVLIALRYVNYRGRVRHHSQLHGIVESIAPLLGVRIAGTSELMTLPPVVRVAPPGTYRIRATGEDLEDPALLAEWTIYERRRHDAAVARRLRSAMLRRERRRAKREG
jgi:hypothetical protein